MLLKYCLAYIHREDGKVLIKHVIPFQTVEYVISKKRSSAAEGRVLRVVDKSPLETESEINVYPHSQSCGGCLYQEINYDNELKIKNGQLKQLILSAAKQSFIWEGIKKSPLSKAYRNKMEYSFGGVSHTFHELLDGKEIKKRNETERKAMEIGNGTFNDSLILTHVGHQICAPVKQAACKKSR